MFRSLLASSLLAAALGAQQGVCVSGVVRPVGGPTICQQGETHYLECTRVYLKSNTVNLGAYVGKLVRIEGRAVGVTCAVIDVTRVQDPAPATLEWCGSASTCCQVKFKVCPIGMGRAFLWLSPFSGYRPIGCQSFLDGTLLLGSPLLPVAQWGPGICGEITLPIPCDNALVGVDVWLQGARQDIGPVGPLQLTNAVCLRISPFLPPCAPTNC